MQNVPLGMQVVVYSEHVKSEDWNLRVDGTIEPSTPSLEHLRECQTADEWTGQKFEWTRSQSLHCRLKEHEFRGKDSPSKTSTKSEPLLDAQVATQSKTTKGRELIQIVAEYELENVSEQLHKGQKDWIEGMR